jgi:rod shape determining protein RodA
VSPTTDWSTRRTAPLSTRRRDRFHDIALDRTSPVRRIDWVLLLAVLSLCAIGVVLVWSATRNYNLQRGLDPQAFLKKDLVNIAIGLALGSVAALVDYRTLRAYAPIVYGLSGIGLLAVLSPLGETINGSHSWIPLVAGFEVQPSEFAKVALIVMMAMLLGERRDGVSSPEDGDVWLTLALAAVPVVLILMQPDLGTVLVLAFVIIGVLSISGVGAKWLAGLGIAAVVGIVGVTQLHVLKPYQVDRLTSFADPKADAQGFGYNTRQARIAIGSGGVFGKGLFEGTQTNGHFVPEQQTDFVFTVAGEELGLVGAGSIILLTGLVLWRGLRIASQAGDAFGTLMATGVGIMPVTGLPLPFVSYGGSSMFASMIAVGLLQNVHMRTRR